MTIHGESGDDHTFEKLVRIAFEDHAVLARSRLAFVRIATKVYRFAGVPGNEAPLHSRRKACAAAAAESGSLGRVDHLRRRHFLHDFSGSLISTQLDITIYLLHARIVDVLKEDKLVGHKGTIVTETPQRGIRPLVSSFRGSRMGRRRPRRRKSDREECGKTVESRGGGGRVR